MATSTQIKSAIRSRGASQRDITEQFAGITEQLQRAEESANLFKFKEAEIGRTYGTLSAGLEVGASFLEGVKQKQQLQSNIDFLSESLGEQGKELSMVRGDKSSLIDVFSGKSSLSSYLFGQQQYQLDGKNVGSKYDVSAMGERARALQQDNMLDTFLGTDSLSKKQDFSLDTLETAKVPSITGGPSPLPDYASIEREGGGGLESPKEIKLPTKQDTMMDKVGEKIEKGTLVKSDGNVIPEKIVDKIKDIPQAWMEPANTDMEGNKIIISDEIENEKLSEFIPKFSQSTEKDMLQTIDGKSSSTNSKKSYIDKDGFIVTEGTFLGRPSIIKKSPTRKKKDTSYRPEGRFGNPQQALIEVDKDLKEIKKLESLKGVINPTVKKQSLEIAKKMKKELQEKIKSIYDSSTGKFIDDEYEKVFTGQLEDYDIIESGIDFGRHELPFFTKRKKVDISSIQSFIDSISNKNNLASR